MYIANQKQTHRYKKQISGYTEEKEECKGNIGV